MAKYNLTKGDHVVAKKWSGEEILGLFEYTYSDGSHCIFDVKTNKRFNTKRKDVREVTEEEEKEIKKILKEKKDYLKNAKIEDTPKEEENEELNIALAES